MADKTLIPIGVDPFLGVLDYLNTGSENTGYVPDENVAESGLDPYHNITGGHPANANGQYSSFPGATPKYARHLPGRNRENYDTLARMYIRVKNKARPDRIRKSLKSSVSQNVSTVMLGDGSSASPARGYVDFFLETIQSNLSEKVQVTEVLEDNFVAFFFGASPPMYTFSGNLMNTLQDDWAVQMLSAYEDLFRGTMLARRGLQLYIRYDSYIVSGACVGLSLIRSAANENVVPFTLQMLVHRQHLLYGNAFGATQLPASAGEFVPSNAYPLKYPAVTQLRPLISKVADVPTDGINCVSESYTPPWEKDMKQDDVILDTSAASGQSVVPSDPTKPGAWSGPEARHSWTDHVSTAGEPENPDAVYGSVMTGKWIKRKR
jgi:hypothetical protein